MSGQSDLKALVQLLEENRFEARRPNLHTFKNPELFGARVYNEHQGAPFVLLPYIRQDIACTILSEPYEAKAVFIGINPTYGKHKVNTKKQVLHATYKVRDEGVVPMHNQPFLNLHIPSAHATLNQVVRDHIEKKRKVNIVKDEDSLPKKYELMANFDILRVFTVYAKPGELPVRTVFHDSLGDYNLATPTGMLNFLMENRAYFSLKKQK